MENKKPLPNDRGYHKKFFSYCGMSEPSSKVEISFGLIPSTLINSSVESTTSSNGCPPPTGFGFFGIGLDFFDLDLKINTDTTIKIVSIPIIVIVDSIIFSVYHKYMKKVKIFFFLY